MARGSSSIWGALIGIAALVVVNLVAIGYSYGGLSERVNNLCDRMERIESRIFDGGPYTPTGWLK